MFLKFNFKNYNEGGVSLSGKYNAIPILATYHYVIPTEDPDDGVSFYFGASAGMTMMKPTIRGLSRSFSDHDWAPSIGGQIGLVKQFGKNVSFTASLRGLWTGKAEFKFQGQPAHEDAAVMLMGMAGLSFRL